MSFVHQVLGNNYIKYENHIIGMSTVNYFLPLLTRISNLKLNLVLVIFKE